MVIALKVMILADSFFFCLAWKGAVRDLTMCLSIHGLSTTSDVTGLPLQVLLVDNHSLSSPYYLLLPMTFWSHYSNLLNSVVFVHLLSWVWFFVTPGTEAHQISLSFTISQSLFRFMSIESVMPSSHLIFCHPLLLSVFLSIRVFFFQWVSFVHHMAKVLELQLHQSFQWIFRTDVLYNWLVWFPCCPSLKSLL